MFARLHSISQLCQSPNVKWYYQSIGRSAYRSRRTCVVISLSYGTGYAKPGGGYWY